MIRPLTSALNTLVVDLVEAHPEVRVVQHPPQYLAVAVPIVEHASLWHASYSGPAA